MSNGKQAASGEPGAAARAEVNGKDRTLRAHGLELTLPAKLPFAALRYMSDNPGGAEVVGLLEVLLGPEQLDAVWKLDLDIDQGTELVEQITNLYGTNMGESEASPRS